MHHLPQRPATPACAISHPTPDLVQLHAQAVNGLTAALRQLTSPGIAADTTAFTRALARSMRATTALKRACACTAVSGVTPATVAAAAGAAAIAARAAMSTLTGLASLSTSGGNQ
jgi:hypothetical protein